EIIIVSYGITSKIVEKAIALAQKENLKVGSLRLVVVWPFPDKTIRRLAKNVKAFIVPEINYGQIAREVERCAGNKKVIPIPQYGGLHKPEDILEVINTNLLSK